MTEADKFPPERRKKAWNGRGARTFRPHSLEGAFAELARSRRALGQQFIAAGKPPAALEHRRCTQTERENRFRQAAWALCLRGAASVLAEFRARLAREDRAEIPAAVDDILRFSGRPREMPQAWRTIRVARALARAAHAELDAAAPPSREAVRRAVNLVCRAVEIAMNLDESYPRAAREAALTMAKVDFAAIQRRCGEFSTALDMLDDAIVNVLYNADPVSIENHECGAGEECMCLVEAERIVAAMASTEGAMILTERARTLHELGRTNEALGDVALAIEILEVFEDARGVAECRALRKSIFNRGAVTNGEAAEPCRTA